MTNQEAMRRVTGRLPLALVTLVLALTLPIAALAHVEHPVAAGATLGHVDFQVECVSEVRADFDRALGLMHHMMYDQARAQFEAVASADPTCAMAYWGIATTLFQPLWPGRPGPETLQRGAELSEQARALAASDREAALIEATAAFFDEPETAEYWQRIERWADGMAAAYASHPDDLDTMALYGLSRIALSPIAQDRGALFDDADAVLAEVFEQEPLHPGGIHYAIHATDVDGRAGRALEQVAVYGDIAPQVPHALHMPTHIYVRLGEWPGVIAWNRRSADAALDFPAGDRISLHYIHALDYMLYAALQQGDDEYARAVLDEAISAEPYQEDFAAAFHLAIMPARFAVERRAWPDAAGLPLQQPEYLSWSRYSWPQAIGQFARGLGAVHTGDIAAARDAEARLIELRDQASAAGERAFAAYIDIDRSILSGKLAWVDGDIDGAVAMIEEAAALERTVEKHPVTPGALLPPYEALGDLLMEVGRYADALAAYEASDAMWPRRLNTLLGGGRAALAMAEEQAAREHFARLLDIAGASEREALAEVRAFMGHN
jgi:tetratricopeptide (TPR) repeat protein